MIRLGPIFIGLLSGLLFNTEIIYAQEIREYMDLQIHTTMHVPYKFFGHGLQYFGEGEDPKLKHKHQFKNVNYANYLKANKGARIFINGALANAGVASKKKAKKLIITQLEYVNKFIEENSDHFALARTPEEVRHLIHNTDKTVIIHSIEGGKKLINGPADAKFWANQGVSFITLIHLIDYKSGASAFKPGVFTTLLNFRGKFKTKKKRGLKDHGENAIHWLANEGIMIDISHMAPPTRVDALELMEAAGIPPIATHDLFKPIQNNQRGIDTASILKIYKNGGLMSLPISGYSLKAHKPYPEYRAALDSIENYCPGSIDTYKFTYSALKSFIERNVVNIHPEGKSFSELSEEEKVRYSIGFQSDFNGWLNHSRPRYGRGGCHEIEEGVVYEDIELFGMTHPGLLESNWKLLEKENVDLSPIRRSSERFLQIWQFFLDNKGSFVVQDN
ncbi:MAG: membrane dipeptidase [Bacteroidota bacterium]